jgi:hypothetical protein
MANFLTSIGKSLLSGSLSSSFNKSKSEALNGSLYYPDDLSSADDRPLVRFTCMPPGGRKTNIYFPMPAGVQMNDSMSYNSNDLGILGYSAMKLAQVRSTGDFSTSAGDIVKSIVPGGVNAAIATIARAANTNQEIGAGIAAATQMAENKNTVTTFEGCSIRNHTFAFKMIARSPEESQMIKNIQFAFRSGMYPTAVTGQDVLLLNFPAKWEIRYVSLPGLADLTHLPQPYECYLQNFSTSFNSSSQMWRNDKAPLEVDITLSFVETKMLTAPDIVSLQYGKSSGSTGLNIGQQSIKDLWDDRDNIASEIAGMFSSDNNSAPNGSVGSPGENGKSPFSFGVKVKSLFE